MGTGLDVTCGFAAEEKYGEYKAPSKFIEVESVGLARQQEYLSSRPLRGRPGVPSSRHKETTRRGEGPIALEVPNKGLGQLLNLLHGETVTPEKLGETKAYKQVHKIGVTSPQGKSLTIQVNKPTVEADQAFTYLGCKFTQATFSVDTSAQLKASFDVMAADVSTSQELAEASYSDPISSFDWTQTIVKIGGEEIAEDLLITSFGLSIPLPMKTGRYGLGQGATQLEPIGFNDSMVPTWDIQAEFSNMELYEHYVGEGSGGEPVAISVSFVGDKIAEGGENKETITFETPEAKFVGSDPEVGGPDVLEQSASVEVYDDITNPLATITTISADSAL